MASKFHSIVDELIDGNDKRAWRRKPSLIIIHHTGTGNFILSKLSAIKQKAYGSAVARYLGLADKAYVSAHIQIDRDGTVHQIVDPRTHVAFHAGKSKWFDAQTKLVLNGCNDFAVGIELLGDGNKEPYSEVQLDKLIRVIRALCDSIPTLNPARIAGHQNIAPDRKVDPGKFFPWGWLENKLGVRIKLSDWGRLP